MALISMTGFGSAEWHNTKEVWTVAIKSVNHRNFNWRFSAPANVDAIEHKLKAEANDSIIRGSLSVLIHSEKNSSNVDFNWQLAQDITQKVNGFCNENQLGKASFSDILNLMNQVTVRHPQESLPDELPHIFSKALTKLHAMRVAEGEQLQRDLSERIAILAALCEQLKEHSSEVIELGQQKAQERFATLAEHLQLEMDESRVAQEILLLSDKCDITEEVVRISAHLKTFSETMTASEPIAKGKRLDFLTQELLREFNTIGSKARNTRLTDWVVDAKVELEKIREQTQNVL